MYNNPIDEVFNGTPELTDEMRQQMALEEQARAESQQLIESQAMGQQAATPAASAPSETSTPKPSAPKGGQNALQVGFDALSAAGTGLNDYFIDELNKAPFIDFKKRPKFENEAVQSVREISSMILPMVMLGAAGKRAGAKAHARLNMKLGNDPAFKFVAERGLEAGVGAYVGATNKLSEKDDNLQGMLKKTWPKTYSWIKDDWATLDTDSPDVKRAKNINEGVGLDFVTNLIGAGMKLAKSIRGVKKATKWVPENELAKNNLPKLMPEEAAMDPDEAVDYFMKASAKTDAALDDIGSYNLTKNVDLDTPIFGVHDLYDEYESGIRTLDDGGILGASVDVVRINKNIDTVYGRVGSVVSEGALKYGLEVDQGGETIIRGLAETLKDAGKYGYETAGGRYISHAEVMDAGERLAADLMDMDVSSMKRVLAPLSGIDPDTGLPVLKSEAYAGVFKAIKGYLDEFMNMDYVRAQAYTTTSFAGQVSDMAQGMRLMEGTAAVERAQEQILDRLEFLMARKGITSYTRGRALNMLNLWNRVKAGVSGKSAEELIKQEKNETLRAIQRIASESKGTIDTLRAVKAERPELLGPLMLAYEVTDGKVSTISKLNDWIRKKNSTFSRMLVDSSPEVQSAWTQGVWANIYNSVLSALVTPVKAGLSNAITLAERPIATALGASDAKTMRRGWYMYSGAVDTLQKGFSHMNQVYRRAASDPSSVGYIMRDDIVRANENELAVMRAFADAAEQNGQFGPSAMLQQVEALNDLAQHPWLRFSSNAMSAFDGFTRAVIGNWEARGRAFDAINPNGMSVDKKMFRDIADKAYSEMFDETGIITDSAVEHASREIAMNLDSPMVNSLSALIARLPVLKPFLMFNRTAVSMLQFAGTHNPLAHFVENLSKFDTPFEKLPLDQAEQLLVSRGIPFDESAPAAYETIRAELRGRKAIGTLAVTGAVGMMLNDRLRGNGHYDKEKQRLRREAGWKPRTYKGLDGKWYSYDNLGAISDWIALTADVMDNFDTLDEPSFGTIMNKMGYLLGANLTNKSFLAGLEPMNDVLSGRPDALSRWGASFASSLVPGSGIRGEFSRLLTPQLKEVEQELLDLVANRNPIAKDTLPDVHDWIDGGKVGMPDSIWTRIWNTYSPWKVHDGMSEEKQFLVDVEFDARPSLQTNGKGVDYTNEMRSQVTDRMGQDGYFKQGIREVMNGIEGKKFRQLYKEARRRGANVDAADLLNVHHELRTKLRQAQRYAESRIELREEVMNMQYINAETKKQSRLGDVEAILRLQQQ
jgi:hypothetical protein